VTVQTYIGTLVVEECCRCGVAFGLTADLQRVFLDDRNRSFYCPNGHRQHYTGKTDAQRATERAERAEALAERRLASMYAARDQAAAAERSARTLKGHVTRLRNRIAAGLCPVPSCRRNFLDVKVHIATEHPAWAHEHPDALT
jgi:hypothetical protein